MTERGTQHTLDPAIGEPTDELLQLDAVEQARLVRRGDVLPAELVACSIRRIEVANPELNAVVVDRFERAVLEAESVDRRAPFAGVPFLMKDAGALSGGDRHHAGMSFLRRLGWSAPHDSHFTAKLKRAGFIILGSTNTPELALQATTEPDCYGPARNPWDTRRSTFGSSGGAAAAVAAGFVAAAHGNDGAGSIRLPASACGLVGLKPSRGRVSLGPDLSDSAFSLATEHVLCRTVRDTAAILDLVQGAMPGDAHHLPPPSGPFADAAVAAPPRLRIGVFSASAETTPATSAACRDAVAQMAAHLEEMGHIVSLVDMPTLGRGIHIDLLRDAWAAMTHLLLRNWEVATGDRIGRSDVEPLTWALAEAGTVAWDRRAELRADIHAFTVSFVSWWDEMDLLLTPTAPAPPPFIGELKPAAADPMVAFERQLEFLQFTMPANLTGQPAISIPCGSTDDGVPVGVQLVAGPGQDALVLSVAGQLERALSSAARSGRP